MARSWPSNRGNCSTSTTYIIAGLASHFGLASRSPRHFGPASRNPRHSARATVTITPRGGTTATKSSSYRSHHCPWQPSVSSRETSFMPWKLLVSLEMVLSPLDHPVVSVLYIAPTKSWARGSMTSKRVEMGEALLIPLRVLI